MKAIKGGITAPKGFLASGVNCGIKKKNLDLGLVYSQKNAACVGFFTSNKVKAAPVLLGISRVKMPIHRAIIINSGCANCLTGKGGMQDAKLMAKKAAISLGVKETQVLPCSTGGIGKKLKIKNIISKLPALVSELSRSGSSEMAKAIMTTDTHPKQAACSFKIGNKEVKIGGIAKGAGMIAPNMVYPEPKRGATTICVITTDANVNKITLKTAAKEAISDSFNCITVDGAMSTNDTFFCLANGASGVRITPNSNAYEKFSKALSFVALALAKMVAKDGEGATKFVEVQVRGAKGVTQAKRVAFGVANSNLVKTALYGEDANIGRVASACGASDIGIKQEKLNIYFNGKLAVKNGTVYAIKGLDKIFKKTDIKIRCELKLGKASYRVFTSDLSTEYVKINANYYR